MVIIYLLGRSGIMDFLLDNLILIIIFFVLLLIVSIFFRALKLALFIGIIILIVSFFGGTFGKDTNAFIDKFSSYSQETIVPLVESNLETSEFVYDKTTKEYVIGSDSFRISGKKDTNLATIEIKKKSYEIDATFLSEFINKKVAEIEQPKN
jgi:hypothetical protein